MRTAPEPRYACILECTMSNHLSSSITRLALLTLIPCGACSSPPSNGAATSNTQTGAAGHTAPAAISGGAAGATPAGAATTGGSTQAGRAAGGSAGGAAHASAGSGAASAGHAASAGTSGGAGASSGAGAGAGGAGDTTTTKLPPTTRNPKYMSLAPAVGEPLPRDNMGMWNYIDIPGALSRDGSPAGFY
jgi:hypothetical protein